MRPNFSHCLESRRGAPPGLPLHQPGTHLSPGWGSHVCAQESGGGPITASNPAPCSASRPVPSPRQPEDPLPRRPQALLSPCPPEPSLRGHEAPTELRWCHPARAPAGDFPASPHQPLSLSACPTAPSLSAPNTVPPGVSAPACLRPRTGHVPCRCKMKRSLAQKLFRISRCLPSQPHLAGSSRPHVVPLLRCPSPSASRPCGGRTVPTAVAGLVPHPPIWGPDGLLRGAGPPQTGPLASGRPPRSSPGLHVL